MSDMEQLSFWEDGINHRRCRKCNRILPIDSFRFEEKRKLRHRQCGDCRKQYSRAYQRKKLLAPNMRAIHNERVRKTNETRKSRQRIEYVYLIKFPTGEYKIGRTTDPKHRLQNLYSSLPFKLEYAALIKTNNMAVLEKQLHERFWSKRIRGEWFKLSTEDVDYIKGLQP